MALKQKYVDVLMNEVILYGGLPVRRCDVYRDALERTGSERAADMFAFGRAASSRVLTDVEPISFEQLQAIR